MGIYIGMSGWSYAHWQGVLYPHDLAPCEHLNYDFGNFGTVELKSSYSDGPPMRPLLHGAIGSVSIAGVRRQLHRKQGHRARGDCFALNEVERLFEKFGEGDLVAGVKR